MMWKEALDIGLNKQKQGGAVSERELLLRRKVLQVFKPIHPSEVMELSQHTSEVFMWNPRFTNLIATGSGDAFARIWMINSPDASKGYQQSKLLLNGHDSGDK